MKSTLSFHMGTSFNIQHNNRTIPVPCADSDYEQIHNWYYEGNTTLEEAYERIFGDSFREYNSTVRKDRQFESYLQKLQTALDREKEKVEQMRLSGEPTSQIRKFKKAVKPAYEIVIGLGNVRDNPEFAKNGELQNEAKEILSDYVKQFQKENPNVYVYNASIHTGENGTAHLHFDVIFIADDCKRGMRKQASLTKALNQMEYYSDQEKGTDGKRLNAVTKWEMAQRDILKNICSQRGLEITDGKHSKQHLSTKEYQAKMDSEFIDHQAEQLLAEQDRFIEYMANSDYAVSYLEHIENEKLHKENLSLQTVKQRANSLLEDSWEEYNNATADYFEQYRQNKSLVFMELQRARAEASRSRKHLNNLLRDVCYSNDFFIVKLLKLVYALCIAFGEQAIDEEVKRLQEANNNLKQQSKIIMKESKTTGDILRSADIDNIEMAIAEYEEHLKKSLLQIKSIQEQSQIRTECER